MEGGHEARPYGGWRADTRPARTGVGGAGLVSALQKCSEVQYGKILCSKPAGILAEVVVVAD